VACGGICAGGDEERKPVEIKRQKQKAKSERMELVFFEEKRKVPIFCLLPFALCLLPFEL
jgi:hypothetical protein